MQLTVDNIWEIDKTYPLEYLKGLWGNREALSASTVLRLEGVDYLNKSLWVLEHTSLGDFESIGIIEGRVDEAELVAGIVCIGIQKRALNEPHNMTPTDIALVLKFATKVANYLETK
jgi:hypothetical protein